MVIGFNTELREVQKLTLSPEIKQSLQILQYSSQELWNYLQKEMESNPLLEIDEAKLSRDEGYTQAERAPVDWKEFFRHVDYNERDMDNTFYQDEEQDYSYENMVSQQVTLHEYLKTQLEMQDISPVDKKVGIFIIDSLDDNGYLKVTKHQISQLLNVDRTRISRLLSIIQSFDPPGVGARSLRECLLLQLKRMGQLTTETKIVVLECLKDIANNRLDYIARKLGVGIEEVYHICTLVKSLEPKPGRQFPGSRGVGYILPDIVVEATEDGYHVVARDRTAPRLQISKTYQRMLENPQMDPKVVEYLSERLNSATRIIRAVEQRKSTLVRVVESIVRFQREFLDKGILYLKPLTLEAVAQDIGVHESTVSRAISSKYVQTPRGVFELKYFFDSGGVSNGQGEGISAHSVKKMIQDIIAGENPKRPLSDKKIVSALKEQGIEISRRTVAKYRDEMGIPSSTRRKKHV